MYSSHIVSDRASTIPTSYIVYIALRGCQSGTIVVLLYVMCWRTGKDQKNIYTLYSNERIQILKKKQDKEGQVVFAFLHPVVLKSALTIGRSAVQCDV